VRTALTSAELESYHELGFLVIPDFLAPEEIDELEAACVAVIAERNEAAGVPVGSLTDGGFTNPANGLFHHMNPWMDSPRIRKFSTDARVAEVTAQLEGIEDIRLYQDMIAVKPAWGGPTGFHMDVPRISFTADHAVSYWIPLVDSTLSNACLYYVPGVHKEKRASFHDTYPIGELDRIDPSWNRLEPVPAPVRRGGIVVHEGYAPHGTNANMTPHARPAFVITHMPVGATFDGTPNLVQPGEMPIGAPLNDESRFPLVLGRALDA
jgi:ectoine hydroxylase-related dioxygenase (phytanoyl-CoA dioxygenase family)